MHLSLNFTNSFAICDFSELVHLLRCSSKNSSPGIPATCSSIKVLLLIRKFKL